MTIDNDAQFTVNVPLARNVNNGYAYNATVRTGNAAAQRGGVGLNPGTRSQNGGNAAGFSEILGQAARRNAASRLKISKHAENRLTERNIRLSDSQRDKIADALVKAGSKGVKDALVMINGFALVANAGSMTVITAVGEDDLRQNIFTNIDGAVFA